MTHTSTTKSCPYCPHLGVVGCLPAPNIFHLANEFAKGKMFLNFRKTRGCVRDYGIYFWVLLS